MSTKDEKQTALQHDAKLPVSCCALLEELQLKLIAMSCFAQEHFNEKAYEVTKMNIDEIKHWIKKKRSQHSC